MTKSINLNALQIFAMAAELGNFQRAADALNLSHGAVSQRIKGLEEALGTRLFDRAARGVRLTAAGAAYHDEIAAPLARIEAATRALHEADRPITFRVGPSFATRWLMPRLARFRAAHPDLSITTDVQETALAHPLGPNELAILPGELVPKTRDLELRPLVELSFLAVCHPDLPRPPGALSLAQILALPLLQDAKRRWEHLITAEGFPGPATLLNFDRSALALDAARNGHGVAMAPRHLIDDALAAGDLVTLWQAPAPTGEALYLCWTSEHGRARGLRRTLGWVLAEFGQPPL
ncbi:LysR family transcriptional regulator [Dinoroseobacter sp. S375]|uniref:LysR family transcriptional regulator n=1 Tax=Dinoroseobacter sp. S375 TaxID=3415136 RepID=UPI003C7AE12E